MGTAQITVEYRVDSDPCWRLWTVAEKCYARSSCELEGQCYPSQTYREGDAWSISLPNPPYPACNAAGTRPSNIGYAFQLRISITGWCRVCGVILYSTPKERAPYYAMSC
jgi:hypothetical protein